jgi:hypothetical protein
MKTEFRRWHRRHGAVGIGGAVLAAALLVLGCGGGSGGSSDGAAAAFMGHWEIEGTTSSFTLSCPQTIGNVAFPIWSELVLDHGVLSDLTDVSTACSAPGINFDIDSKGVVAAAVNPDPYTGAAPLCHWVLFADANGLPVFVDFTFTDLTITKLQTTSSEKAPRVLYAGTAAGPLVQDDGSGAGNFVTVDTCSYTGTGDVFHRTTQP